MSNNGRVDVKDKIWEISGILRDDGMHINNYVDQMTILLFLKMMDEREQFGEQEIDIPEECEWSTLREKRGEELLDHYNNVVVPTLGQQDGVIGEIFARVNSQFRTPVNLKQAIQEIDSINWTALDVDVKGAAYESLLEKYAEKAEGAGQYFTPRSAIKSIVKAVDPGPDDRIHDPAAGTGGFLIQAFEHILEETDGGVQLSRDQRRKLTTENLTGIEFVPETRRLGLMNLALHDIQPDYFEIGDSLAPGEHTEKRYDIVMTNPPYGGNQQKTPPREDFLVETTRPELNFIQHAITLLKDGGTCGMVVPDGVLAVQSNDAKAVRERLVEEVNLHTVLVLPEGAFHPYTGITTNVIFFDKTEPTDDIWFYDLRTGIEKIKKTNPLSDKHFEDFLRNFSSRDESDRYFRTTKQQVKADNYNLNYKRYREFENNGPEIPQPSELLTEVISLQETAKEHTETILSEMGDEVVDAKDVEGWQWVEIQDLGEIKTGSTPKRSNDEYWEEGTIPWVSPKDMKSRRIDETQDRMTELALRETSSKKIPEGSILLVTRSSILDHTLPVAVSDVELTINQDMKALVLRDDVNPNYLLFALRAFGNDILQECSKEGTTVASLDSDKLYTYSIPLPPLEKQKQIAEKLGSIHGTIDELDQEILSINDKVEILSESVLNHVFEDEIVQQAGEITQADGGSEDHSLNDFS